jgi:threonyl-tRNA synthetase
MFVKHNDQSIELPEGSTAKDLADKLNQKGPNQALGASINGKTVDLGTHLQEGDSVILWSFEDPQGKEIYWHTSAHVLAQAYFLMPSQQSGLRSIRDFIMTLQI